MFFYCFPKENMHKNLNNLSLWEKFQIKCGIKFSFVPHLCPSYAISGQCIQPKVPWMLEAKGHQQHHSENCLGSTRSILGRNTWRLHLHSRGGEWFRNHRSPIPLPQVRIHWYCRFPRRIRLWPDLSQDAFPRFSTGFTSEHFLNKQPA